ncbi:MAG: phosphoribosylformylglycinamidine synthase subunit PurS [Thermodesulfobacteriota bacterium]
MKAKVYVTLKKGVLDPQGKAVLHALESMGYDEAKDVRIGKFIEVELNGASKEDNEKRLNEMCDKLLSNPVMEDYRIEFES